MALWTETWVKTALANADRAAKSNDLDGISRALRPLPVELYILLFFDPVMENYPNLKRWLPALPPEDDQRAWAGNVGAFLMQQGAVFLDRLFDVHRRESGIESDSVTVLDYGCGWGRLIRLLYRYVSANQIYGLDPWPPSLERCQRFGVHAQIAQNDYIPQSLPFKTQFDIIFAYSVFTHISHRAQTAILDQWRKRIKHGGESALVVMAKS